MKPTRATCIASLAFLMAISPKSEAITITVDYTYDTLGFFGSGNPTSEGALATAAMSAAASRWSSIITSTLSSFSFTDNAIDNRIGFTHPGTGASYEVSPAASSASDAIIGAGGSVASEYRGPWSLATDEWILYAGGRSLSGSVAGIGGTGTGTNFTSVSTDPASHLNRGFRATSLSGDLPVWGGSISFDNDGSTPWHYDMSSAAPPGEIDFYSIALHEIGHALGLASSWPDFTDTVSGPTFTGTNSVGAFNVDNGTSATSLSLVGGGNNHWADGTHDSKIFASGSPNYTGTVGAGVLQDLLMEPTADFTATIKRLEVTNVDVGAARDVGWSTLALPIPEPSGAGLLLLGLAALAGRRR